MTTEPNYTDAQIEAEADEFADYGATQAADMLRSLLSERQAAMQGQGGEVWRCFHCNETFTNADAATEHFGASERQNPACQIDITEYRAMEARMVRYNDEDADIHRQWYGMQNEHQQALRRAEEDGYAKGLAAMQGQVECDACRGTRYITRCSGNEKCWKCNGTGNIASPTQNGEAIAWMTPGGDVSRSYLYCAERCRDGQRPIPLSFAALQPPRPVRSVSDEDVDAAMEAFIGSGDYDFGVNGYFGKEAMRAALEHFAAIAQEKQS
jgi:hypothetical protein